MASTVSSVMMTANNTNHGASQNLQLQDANGIEILGV
jgi:hypothetical protein